VGDRGRVESARRVAAHMAAYAAKVKDMIASRVIHVLSPAE